MMLHGNSTPFGTFFRENKVEQLLSFGKEDKFAFSKYYFSRMVKVQSFIKLNLQCAF